MTAHHFLTTTTFLATAAAAGATTSPVVLVAPGNGVSYFILSVSLTGWWTNPAGAMLFAGHTGGLEHPLMVEQGGARHAAFYFPEPGWRVGDNTAYVIDINSSVANCNGVFFVTYFKGSV